MTDRRVNVTIALPIADELHEAIRNTDPSLNVTALTRAQRRVYRGGRPLWAGYPEPPRAEDESGSNPSFAKQRFSSPIRSSPTTLSIARRT